MSIKKITAFFLAVVLLLPNMIWAGDMDKELTRLIPIIKQKINVPEALTEFRYDLREQNGDSKENIYTLSWADKDYKIGNMQVTVEADGNIISYSKNMYNNGYTILAKVSYNEGLKAAKDFMAKIKVPYTDRLKLEEETDRTQDNQFVYIFDEYVNGIKVKDRKVGVYVNKQSGEVDFFSGLSTYDGSYGNNTPKLSLEKAKIEYLNKIGISLVYNLNYDYKTKKINSFPVYAINNSEDKVIDALTGEVLVPQRERAIYYDSMNMKKEATMTAADKGAGLTPQEQQVVDEVKGLLTKEEAKSAAERFFPKIKDVPITNAGLYKSEYDNRYVWSIAMENTDQSNLKDLPATKIKTMIAAGDTKGLPPYVLKNISISVDAKTGEVLSYYYYTNSDDQKPKISQDEAKTKSEAFLKSIAKEKFSQTKYDPSEEIVRPLAVEDQSPYINFTYKRIVNGIPVNGNGLNVTYDAVNDEVRNYSVSWNELTFKSVSNVISKQKVVDKIGLELMYVSKDKKNKVLAYAHDNSYMAFDPFTGIRVNSYDGKPVNEGQQAIYDDIKGHAKEDIIKKLYDSGISLPGKSFKPDSTINQIDLLRFILKISDENITKEDIYERAVEMGILTDKEKNSDLLMTREQAVKYIINSTNYKDIAGNEAIFNYPFKDENQVSKGLKGYITLAYGLQIIQKDKTNKFNPKAQLTRAEAAQLIYNQLVQQK